MALTSENANRWLGAVPIRFLKWGVSVGAKGPARTSTMAFGMCKPLVSKSSKKNLGNRTRETESGGD